MNEELASVREVVDLSPQEALDSAQALLVRQGYSIVHRTATTLTAQRPTHGDAVREGNLNLVITAIPQPQGGIKVKVRGTDREGLRERQAQWAEWSENLPKRSAQSQPESDNAPEREMATADQRAEMPPMPIERENVSAARYCSNCGHPLESNARF